MARKRMCMDGTTLLMFEVSSLRFRVATLNPVLSVKLKYLFLIVLCHLVIQLETSNSVT